MKAATETALVKSILQYLALRGWPAWRCNTGAVAYAGKDGRKRFVRFGAKGMPDIIGAIAPAGRMICVECKTPTGRLSPDQRAALDNLSRAGVFAVCVRSVNELAEMLEGEGY